MAIELLSSFLQRATASGAKSTVLTELKWFAGIAFAALLLAAQMSTPSWILIGISAVAGLVSLLFLSAYIYFAIRSPDSLRSERFTLSKMAIERSIKGDNLSGLIDPDKPLQLPASETREQGL